MKYFIDGVIVVEGTKDSSFLSSFIDALYVETNGFDIDEQEIDFLNNCNKKVIILTDSDNAGIQIRKKLSEKIKNAINVSVNISCCNKNNKHGVAECEKNEIINVLKEHFTTRKSNCHLSNKDLMALKINSKIIRNKLCEYLHLGRCNQKELIKRLNFKEIDFNKLEKAVEIVNGN